MATPLLRGRWHADLVRRTLWIVLVVATGCGLDLVGATTSSFEPSDDAGVKITHDGSVINDAAKDDTGAPKSDAGSGCAACPSNTAHSLCVSNACVDTRRVFTTAGGFPANLGGYAGADAKCQAAAQAAGLNGTWMAWLGSNNKGPNDRWTLSAVPYRLLNGTIVANSFAAMMPPSSGDVQVAHAIDLDEHGQPVSTSNSEVWTGLNEYGFLDETCNDWTDTSSAGNGAVGHFTSTSYDFTWAYEQQCSRTTQHLYCFEQ
jgi:hypothetical protein